MAYGRNCSPEAADAPERGARPETRSVLLCIKIQLLFQAAQVPEQFARRLIALLASLSRDLRTIQSSYEGTLEGVVFNGADRVQGWKLSDPSASLP